MTRTCMKLNMEGTSRIKELGVREIYDKILNLTAAIICATLNAMILSQSWGYNGHKRKYRYYNLLLGCYRRALQNEMFDDHQIIAPLDTQIHPVYNPKDMKEHSYKWKATIDDAVGQLRQLNLALMNAIGRQSKSVHNILCLLYKEKEQIHRWIQRAEELDWYGHDLHRQDDELHEKIKRKEKKYGM